MSTARQAEASATNAELKAKGAIRLKAATTSDLDCLPQYEVPDGVSPLDVLLAERAEEDR